MSDKIDAAVERIFQAAYGAGQSIPTVSEVARAELLAAEQRGAAAVAPSSSAPFAPTYEDLHANRQFWYDSCQQAWQERDAYHASLRDAAQRARELLESFHPEGPFGNYAVRDFLRSLAEEK